MPSLPPSLMAPAWDFALAGQSLSRMAGAYGPPTTLPVARVLLSPYPPKSRDLNDDRSRYHSDVIGDAHGALFHWLKFLDSAAPIGLGHIDIAFGIDCQCVAVGKFTDLVT